MGYLDKMVGKKISTSDGRHVLGMLLEINSVGIVLLITPDSTYIEKGYDYCAGDVMFASHSKVGQFKVINWNQSDC